MPIKKTWGLFASIAGTIAALAVPSAAFAGGAAQPGYVDPLPTESCVHPPAIQALLAYGDENLYTLAPGGAFSDPAGWELLGNASMGSADQADGSTGGVLNLPPGSQATSPPMCITVDYPTARLWARGLDGSADVEFNVVYWKNGEWTKPKHTGNFKGDKKGWGLSKEMKCNPEKHADWQQVRFVLFNDGKSNVQVDNFWVDPRASR